MKELSAGTALRMKDINRKLGIFHKEISNCLRKYFPIASRLTVYYKPLGKTISGKVVGYGESTEVLVDVDVIEDSPVTIKGSRIAVRPFDQGEFELISIKED